MEPSSKERKIVTAEVTEKAVFDVLARLPIKSLLQYKLISKGVASIITSTDFIESHMESGRSYELVTFANDSKKYGYASVLLCEEDPDRSEAVDLLNFEFLSTCRGLVLVVDNRPAVKQQLYVSNPAIRKTIALPIINESLYYVFTSGLGFNAEENTYKVLVLSTNERNKMYICRFRPSNFDEPIEWEDVSSLAPSSYARKKNVFMKGAIHWVAYKEADETHQRNSVLVYNVKTENFSEMNFPSSIEVTVTSNYLLGGEDFKVDISTTDQSIQLVVGSFLHDTGFDIWIMNEYGNPISWSKRSHISPFTIPRNTDYRLNECLPEQTWMDRLSNREIDFDDKLDEPLGVRNGEAVWWKTKKGFLALHDAATGNIRYAPNIRHIQVEGLQLFPDPMFVVKYKESLVLLSEADFQNSTNPLTRSLPPLLDDLPTAVQKEIHVLNQHNEKLVGVLHDTRSREIVVLCHGFKSSKGFLMSIFRFI